MKNFFKIAGITAFVAVIVFALAGCKNPYEDARNDWKGTVSLVDQTGIFVRETLRIPSGTTLEISARLSTKNGIGSENTHTVEKYKWYKGDTVVHEGTSAYKITVGTGLTTGSGKVQVADGDKIKVEITSDVGTFTSEWITITVYNP